MTTMEIYIGLLAILVAINIALIPYFRSKYLIRPELSIEMKFHNGESTNEGLSFRNKFSNDNVVDADTALRIFRLTWRFELIITNNSDQIAFYPEPELNPSKIGFSKIDSLNKLQPIKPAESIKLKAEYSKFEEKTGKERTEINKAGPEELQNLNILLSYQNTKKRTFYTLFDNSMPGDKNRYLRKKPKDYI